jgi:1-acyl-sn-glycerol-3-phosphate acyltransferase
MLKPNSTTFSLLFWKHYSRYVLQKHFHQIIINKQNITVNPQQSVLLLGNHFSWWDGFIGNYINHEFINKKFHVLMLEEQLLKNKILRTSGAFSIQKTSRDMVESLRFATNLLENPNNMLLLYPQGRIESMHNAVPTVEKGWFRIISQLQNQAVQIIFYTALVDYMQHEKPTLHISLQSYNAQLPYNFEELKHSFLTHYTKTKEEQGMSFQ